MPALDNAVLNTTQTTSPNISACIQVLETANWTLRIIVRTPHLNKRMQRRYS